MLTDDIIQHFQFAVKITFPTLALLAIAINLTQSLSILLLFNPFLFFYRSINYKIVLLFIVGALLVNVRYKKETKRYERYTFIYILNSSFIFIQCYYAAKWNTYILHNIIISLLITHRIYTKINESDITDYTLIRGLFKYFSYCKGELLYKTYRHVQYVLIHSMLYYTAYRMSYYIIFGLMGYTQLRDIRSAMDHVIFFVELIVTITVYFLYYELLTMIYCYNISLRCDTVVTKMPKNIIEIRFYMFQKIRLGHENKVFDRLLREYMILELKNLKYLLHDIDVELEKDVFYNGVKIPAVGEKKSIWMKINFSEKLQRRKKISNKLKKDLIEYFKIVRILEELVNLVNSIKDYTVSRGLYQNDCLILLQHVRENSVKLEDSYLINLKSDFLQSINSE